MTVSFECTLTATWGAAEADLSFKDVRIAYDRGRFFFLSTKCDYFCSVTLIFKNRSSTNSNVSHDLYFPLMQNPPLVYRCHDESFVVGFLSFLKSEEEKELSR